MRIFSLLSALAALATAVAGVSLARDAACASEMRCGVTPTAPKRDLSDQRFSRHVRGLTNAELLRRGLPLNTPVLRRGTPVRRTSPSDTPPPHKTAHSGIIEVRNAANGNLLGYIGKNLVNGGAQFGYDPSIANAVLVSFETDSATGTDTQIDISISNSNPAWPLLGFVQGRDDSSSNIAPGSFNYLYLGGIANPGTQPGDAPELISNSYFIGSPRTAESAVWTYDSDTNVLTPFWINTDGSTPPIQYWTQSGGLYAGGDQGAFFARYPAPVTSVEYVFVAQ